MPLIKDKNVDLTKEFSERTLFYLNKIKAKQCGVTIDEILYDWKGDYKKLDKDKSYF